MNTVILADGEFPRHEIPLSYLHKADMIVCCDGAADRLTSEGIIPDIIIGDCDSISQLNREKYAHILHHVAEQYTNDLTKAVNYCLQNNIKQAAILGATGKREDHTIGNIGLLFNYLDMLEVKMVTDYGIFTPIKQATVFESLPNQQVSLFSNDNQPITSEGLQYPLDKLILTGWWTGTLNKSLSDSFKIIPQGKVIVYQAY